MHPRLAPRLAAGLALLLLGAPARPAAFLPGGGEADPPTGDGGPAAAAAAGRPAEPILGSGIRWTLGPVRYRGSLGLDLRHMAAPDGRRSDQALLVGEMEFNSYVWRPWFIQLDSAVGFLQSRERSRDGDSTTSASGGLSLTGRLQASVFPISRFPLVASVGVGDSRYSGETLTTQYRTTRVSLSQNYRPPRGNDSYSATIDYSRVSGNEGLRDSVIALNGTSQHQWGAHALELSGGHSVNLRSADDGRSTVSSASLKHGFVPDLPISTDTLVNWNHTQHRLVSGGGPLAATRTLATDVVQVVSLARWQPQAGEWLYDARTPVSLSGSVRLAQSGFQFDDTRSRSQVAAAAVGIAKQLSTSWRGSAAFGANWQSGSGTSSTSQSSGTGSLSYSSTGVPLGSWRYQPSASFGVSATSGGRDGSRQALTTQFAHGVNRQWRLDRTASVSVMLTQSLNGSHDWPERRTATGLAHTLVAAWQSGGAGGHSVVSASVSDARSRTSLGDRGEFRFANLQLSRQEQLSRYNSWSADLTVQVSRSANDYVDPLDPQATPVRNDDGWQRHYSGTLSFASQRFLGVPRLRLSVLLSANSQQLLDRRLGDVNAPLERTSESLEARLDHTIGRLESRLLARVARVDGRTVTLLTARVQRRF